MDTERIFQTVLQTSKDATAAIEQTKAAVQENTKVLSQVAETNARQTEAITRFITDKDRLERDKVAIDEKYETQLEVIKVQAQKEREKLVKYIIILAVVLFVAVGGATVLRQLKELGLLNILGA